MSDQSATESGTDIMENSENESGSGSATPQVASSSVNTPSTLKRKQLRRTYGSIMITPNQRGRSLVDSPFAASGGKSLGVIDLECDLNRLEHLQLQQASGGSGGINIAEIVEVDPAELLNIYHNACDMFQTHKITPQNAFSIKLLECITDIIELDNFDGRSMQEFGRVLEIGGKIYVCRVDCTHSEVMKLATEINSNTKRKVANGHENENNGEDGVNGVAGEQTLLEAPGLKQRKKKNHRKRGRHIKSEESLEMEFNYARRVQTRRSTMEELFDDWNGNDQDFDYSAYLHRNQKADKEAVEGNSVEAKEHKVKFSLNVVNNDAMPLIVFFPFQFQKMGVWNSNDFDIWGRLFPGHVSQAAHISQNPAIQDNRFEYNSQCPPLPETDDMHSCPDDGELGDFNNGDYVGGYPGGGSVLDKHGVPKPIDINRLKSVGQLGDYFVALKNLHLVKKDPYAWIGPKFVQRRRPPVMNRTKTKANKPKKDPEVIDFLNVEWHGKNRYCLVPREKTTLSGLEYHNWTYHRTVRPRIDVVYDEIEFNAPFEDLDPEDENFVHPLLRYFIDQNRSLLDIFTRTRDRNEHQNDFEQNNDGIEELQDGFIDHDDMMEFEGDREGQLDGSINNDAFPGGEDARSLNVYSNALKSFMHCFPNPVPGQPNPFEDPSSWGCNTGGLLNYATQPKPINIKYLKERILGILVKELKFEPDNGPTLEEETRLELDKFMDLLVDEIDQKTKMFLTIPITIVALLHVIVENKLFITTHGNEEYIVCKGSTQPDVQQNTETE